jgi:hypothetical protein
MTPSERHTLAAAVAELQRLKTERGHLAIVSPEVRGRCTHFKPCTKACRAFVATLTAAEALLAAHPEPVQIRLLGEAS